MSKSKGNVITVDEVINAISSVKDGYELRGLNNKTIDFKKIPCYRNPEDGFYYTLRKNGHNPIFLCLVDDPVPPLICDKLQHINQKEYWSIMLSKWENMSVAEAKDIWTYKSEFCFNGCNNEK